MVAASAVVNAPKWLMSPCPSVSFLNESLIANGMCRWIKRSLKVRKRWVPHNMMSIGGPHKYPFNHMITSCNESISALPMLYLNNVMQRHFRNKSRFP